MLLNCTRFTAVNSYVLHCTVRHCTVTHTHTLLTLQRTEVQQRAVRQAQEALPSNASIAQLRDAAAAARSRAKATLDAVHDEIKRLRKVNKVCIYTFTLSLTLVLLFL
jgi:hypothetical protein